jgi:hypothetical protein
LKTCALLQICVVIPDVVIDEAKGNYPKHLKEKAKAFQKAERELSKLADLEDQPINVPHLINAYDSFLDSLVDDNGVIVAPYPEISAKKLVEKSYENQKPFKDGGEGHKDYLIWVTIKSHILSNETSPPHIFLTNNVKDFCQTDGGDKHRLHPDLAAQIELEHLRPEIQVSMKSVLD